jgi:hypothetical protein
VWNDAKAAILDAQTQWRKNSTLLTVLMLALWKGHTIDTDYWRFQRIQEVVMPSQQTGFHKPDQKKRYMWLGYGSYGGAGQPNPLIDAPSFVRNPYMIEKILQTLGIIRQSTGNDQETKND